MKEVMLIAKLLIHFNTGQPAWVYDDIPSVDRETCKVRIEEMITQVVEDENVDWIESVGCEPTSNHQKNREFWKIKGGQQI